jgi:ATP-dependent metalloprotease FtsH
MVMAKVTNSELLDALLEYAEKLAKARNCSVSSEIFLLSIVDTALNISGIKVKGEELARLLIEFKMLSPIEVRSWDFEKKLLEEIIEKDGVSSFDSMHFQSCLYYARQNAQAAEESTVSSSVLLKQIINDPSKKTKTYISRLKGEENEASADNSAPEGNKAQGTAEKDKTDIKNTAEAEKPEKEAAKAKEAPQKPKKVNKKTETVKLTERIKTLQENVLKNVKGQDNAVSEFISGYFQAELRSLTQKTAKRPLATFVFAGPPGVGKTFLAQTVAEELKIPKQVFDMSEYSLRDSTIQFSGISKTFKDAKAGNVTSFVAENPECILIFDEIEKASMPVIHLFLQILDSGHLRDDFTNEEVSFEKAIIIFTTNAGRPLYENSDLTDYSTVSPKVVLKAIRDDKDPETGVPYFPNAICSRLAQGGVVMFNHMKACYLSEIAKKELGDLVEGFEKEIGIKINIDERVYAAIMFGEGGLADARTVKNRAASFFDKEIFELFRMLRSDGVEADIKKIKEINVGLELPKDNDEISTLFCNEKSYNVLIFTGDSVFDECVKKSPKTNFIRVNSIDEVNSVLRKKQINLVFIDLNVGRRGNEKYLNIEDIDSTGRDVLWSILEKKTDLPIFILQTSERKLNSEEKRSFLRLGVRGFIDVTAEKTGFENEIELINEQLHQEKSMINLAKSNKLVTYETAQQIKNGGKTAEITLFDFELLTAVDSEDNKNVMSNVSKPNVKFDDVVGAKNAKEELKFFIEYLKNPSEYAESGLRAPRGVLLYGPPGTGKTMLAKAVASEAGVTFISAEGNQFIKSYIGQGKDALHDLFAVARRYSPAILFIDELEAIAKERRGGEHSTANGEDVLTALLTEMDGFNTDVSKPVFVLAATNFDVTPGSGKSLDQALLRRFDSKIFVDLPTKDERIEFINRKIAGKKGFEISKGEIDSIAMRSMGMSLANLDSFIELSMRMAIRNKSHKVTDKIFDEAFETFNGGEEKKWDPSEFERTARHEAGHTFICWNSGELPTYVTVVARGNYGGYMLHADNEGKGTYTKDELLSRICTSLGGRAAEIVYYGEKDGLSTGASNDLISATNTARRIICNYGMDEKFGLSVIEREEIAYGELSEEVREAVNAILDEQMKKAVELISQNKKAIDALVKKLMTDNHVYGEEIDKIFKKNTPAKKDN